MARIDLLGGLRIGAVLLFVSLGAVQTAFAEAWGLPELMQTLARQKSAKATFTERKYMAVVDQPLTSSGELSYTAPDKLEKRTLSPRAETLVLDGDRLSLESGRRRGTFNVQSRPEIAAFVESIRGTLAGDLAALQKYYTVDFSGRPDAWKLQLVPTQDAMRKIMSRIRLEGAQDAITLIVFEQADGDRSEMQIQRAAATASP